MKILKPAVTVAVILLGLLLCETAWAHPGGRHGGGHGYYGGHPHGQWHGGGPRVYHGHGGYWRGGVFIAAPLFWYGDPFYDPVYRRYYYDRSVWWYCDFPRGYYPQVLECSVPWRIVSPPPPG